MKLLESFSLAGVIAFLISQLQGQSLKRLFAACLCIVLYSQSTSQSSAATQNNSGDALSYSPTREQEPIFRGAEYRLFPYLTSKGIIYFESDKISNGDLVYHDRSYKNIPLLYDQSTDEVVTFNITGKDLIRLFTPKVHSFKIHNAAFVYLPDSINATTGGLWQVLLDSTVKLFKKEIKTVRNRIIDNNLARVVEVQTKYKLLKNNVEYDVANRDAMLIAFSDQKVAINKFIRQNRRRFRQGGFGLMIMETTHYYVQISAVK